MKLKIGKRYRNGRGAMEEVAGVTAHYREWVWTIQGNWYRQSDGRFISYVQNKETKEWEHIPAPPTELDLIEEVKEEE